MSTGTPDGATSPPASPAASSLGAHPGAPFADGPRLLADVGGTNARFALERTPGAIGDIKVYPCKDFPGIAEVITQYFAEMGVTGAVKHAGIAIANPIDGDQVTMTNHDWRFSIEATRTTLGLQTLKVVNDFAALALAVPALRDDQRRRVGTASVAHGEPPKDAVRVVLGPGTGLGVAGLIWTGQRWIPIASEGGHASFAPSDEREDLILAYGRKKWGHVSYERVASGPGIELIHTVLAEHHAAGKGAPAGEAQALDSAAIVHLAQNGDPLAVETVEVFCRALGSFAGNVAITFGAIGGVYLGGGVVNKLGELFYRSGFRESFEQKGRFVRYLANIPTFVIIADNPAFIGSSEVLAATLRHP